MFERIILSSNENPNYIEFWPVVSEAWRSLFGIKVDLALVTNEVKSNEQMDILQKYGNVFLFPEVEGIPSPNNAKMARHYLASTYGDAICMVSDIDLLPLQTEYYYQYMSHYKAGYLIVNGKDAYVGSLDEGKFPMPYTAGTGNIFKEIINPNGLDYENWLRSFIGTKIFDCKEDISISIHNEDANTFSDESLWRAMISKWPNNDKVINVPRGFNPYTERGICRSNWNVDTRKLKNGVYVSSHLLRPYSKYKEDIDRLLSHVKSIAKYA